MTAKIPPWVTYPDAEWVQISLEEAGLHPEKFSEFLKDLDVCGASFGGEVHQEHQFGAVLTRGGCLVHVWGNQDYRFQTASTGKALMWALLGFAVADKLLDPDEPIHRTWTGADQLSHRHKYLDEGFHQRLTWRHLIGPRDGTVHWGGFPFEIGIRWKEKRTGLEEKNAVPGIPDWADWTGDPFYDCYSHVAPGTQSLYSSGGFWRLGQALTHVWNRDLKDVLQERLFDYIGVPSDRWDWLPGSYVKGQRLFYPEIPDAYTYLDPPYEINGNIVRSGPGWVVISAADLARFGHLNATGGLWKGQQIIDPQWLRGHGGGNKSGTSGEDNYFTALGVVTTIGLPDYQHGVTKRSILPKELFVGPVKER